MHNRQGISLALTTTLVLIQPAFATEVTRGDMAAAIRSADYPCQHVLDLLATGENTWRVQCNSGTYQVDRDKNGQFSVVKTN